METSEKAEEILESLWIHNEDTRENTMPMEDLAIDNDEPVEQYVEQLLEEGYISVADGKVGLTNWGRPYARSIVRRHRLAERLLADILGMGDSLMHERACKFEHILDRGLDESICSLLGHPKVCPHGKVIPPGSCCRKKQKQGQGVVSSLSQLNTGQTGKVAYIYAKEPDQLQKLTAMGILPGAPINLIQSCPSYFFQIGQTQFAVDKEIADSIYVRLVEAETTGEIEEDRPRRHRWRKGRLAQRLGF